jgi:hypothetical protein
MKCRDFERLINAQLDAREAASAAVERALESHGAACPACRAIALRYQTLRRAIAALGPPPAAPSAFADRFLDHWEHANDEAAAPARILRFWPALLPLAAAAALLVAVGLGVRSGWPARPGVAPPREARVIDPAALSDALAAATAATWELARSSSTPAARVGLEVLDASELTETTAALALPEEVGPTAEILRDRGGPVNEGVSPLARTARQAFGFLLGPVDAPPPAPNPTPHGA